MINDLFEGVLQCFTYVLVPPGSGDECLTKQRDILECVFAWYLFPFAIQICA